MPFLVGGAAKSAGGLKGRVEEIARRELVFTVW